MKFHPGVLVAVAAVSTAALAGCDQRPQQACGTIRPDGSRVDCTHHGFGFWPIFLGGYGGGYRGGPGAPAAGAVSRGGFGATAAGHAGGGGAGE